MSRSTRHTELAHRAAAAHIAAAEARATTITAIGTASFCAISSLGMYAALAHATGGWSLILTGGAGVFGVMAVWSVWTAASSAWASKAYSQDAHDQLAYMRDKIARDALPRALDERRAAITIARRTRELEARSDLVQSFWQILFLGFVVGAGGAGSIVLFVAIPPLGIVAWLIVLLCACIFTVVVTQTVFQTVPALALTPLTSRMDRDDVVREERRMVSEGEIAGALQMSTDERTQRGALTQAVGRGEVELLDADEAL